jgi:hypothetical protein
VTLLGLGLHYELRWAGTFRQFALPLKIQVPGLQYRETARHATDWAATLRKAAVWFLTQVVAATVSQVIFSPKVWWRPKSPFVARHGLAWRTVALDQTATPASPQQVHSIASTSVGAPAAVPRSHDTVESAWFLLPPSGSPAPTAGQCCDEACPGRDDGETRPCGRSWPPQGTQAP